MVLQLSVVFKIVYTNNYTIIVFVITIFFLTFNVFNFKLAIKYSAL